MRPTREMRPRPILSSGLGGAIGGSSSSLIIIDADNYYEGTTLEEILAEIGGKLVGYQAHGVLGATETFDAEIGWHSGTLDQNVTISLTANPSGTVSSMVLELAQDGTGGWTIDLPASVLNSATLEAAFDTTAGVTTLLLLMSRDGGTNWFGFMPGAGGGSALTIEDDGTPLATAATTLDFVGAGVTATGAGTDKTITIPGGATASDTGIWRPLMDSGSGMVIVDGATGEATMGFGPA